MTTYLGKSCSFCLPRVPFVNCRQFMYLVISLLVLRAGYGIWLYQFLIIAYLFTLQLCQNYRTISLISHPSKVMLKIILNRRQSQAEEIIVEEQAGFRAGSSTTEQIIYLRILVEKYLQHQQNLYHVFIDFKKAFDRVWHEALWATVRKYASIIRPIENLYDKAQSTVLFNGSTWEWFRTTVGVRQGCLLSPTHF